MLNNAQAPDGALDRYLGVDLPAATVAAGFGLGFRLKKTTPKFRLIIF